MDREHPDRKLEHSDGHPTVEAVAGAVRGLGLGGVGLVLWTTIMVAALLKADYSTITFLWDDLFRTWVGLSGIAVLTKVLFARLELRAAQRPKLVPIPAQAELKFDPPPPIPRLPGRTRSPHRSSTSKPSGAARPRENLGSVT